MMRAALRRTLVAAILAALLASASALADTRSLRDPRGDTPQLRRHGRLDIVKVAVSHAHGLVVHTVVVRSKVKPKHGRERPVIAINVRGGKRSDPEYLVFGEAIFRVRKGRDPKQVGTAELTSRGRRWVYRFDPAQLKTDAYGWAAITTKGHTSDVAPDSRYLTHRL
jgi:hypothetical protein